MWTGPHAAQAMSEHRWAGPQDLDGPSARPQFHSRDGGLWRMDLPAQWPVFTFSVVAGLRHR